jgi:hypothetical protein
MLRSCATRFQELRLLRLMSYVRAGDYARAPATLERATPTPTSRVDHFGTAPAFLRSHQPHDNLFAPFLQAHSARHREGRA